MRLNEKDSRNKIELGESHSNVDEGHKDYKVKPITQACIWMKKTHKRLQSEKLKPLDVR